MTKADFLSWLRDDAVRAALCQAVWTTDDVVKAPAESATNPCWSPDSYARLTYTAAVDTRAAVAALAGKDVTDEPAIIAGVLAGLDPAAIAAAIPPELARQVADELRDRLAA